MLCSHESNVAKFICSEANPKTGKNIVCNIGRRLTEATGDQREIFWFLQRLSLAVHRGNVASIPCAERERHRFFGR